MTDDKVQELTVDAKSKAHSDADFMNEIDQQMSEIKKVPSNPPSHKASEDLAPEKQNPPSNKAMEDFAREEKTPAEDKGEIILVKKIPKITVLKPEVAKTDSPASSVGKPLPPINLGTQAEQENQESENPPPHEATNDLAQDAWNEEQGTSETIEEEIESIPVRVKKSVTDDDMTSETNDANWLDSIPTPEEKVEQIEQVGQGEQGKQEENSEGEKQPEDSRQTLKTFDATKYHIPIKEGQHSRHHSVSPWVAVLSLGLLVLIVVIAAIDMGVLDIGIDLPFDIL